MRAKKLYELYRQYNAIEDIPTDQREKLEKTVFKQTFGEVWQSTRDYFLSRKPEEVTRAEKEPHHKMALIFRSYLGQASRWANSGVTDRRIDFQIWCGPAMGAFNEWASDSFLAHPSERHIDVVAMNILYGVAKLNRINAVRCGGIMVPGTLTELRPMTINEINERQL
jgi:PfaD family protein